MEKKTKKEKKMSDTLKVDFLNELDEPPNSDLTSVVESSTPIKEWLVNYVGEKVKPDTEEITLTMVLDIVADEFPEFVLPIAEENFIRGYKQALSDVELGEQLIKESSENNFNTMTEDE